MQLDWDKASAELAKPLDAKAIRPPAPGKFGEYVDGLHVISEANRIFGRNGWSYEITRMEQASGQVFTLKGKEGPYEQYRCAWFCTVRVTVDGVTREGAAVGTGNGKPENIGDVIESAVKEAETDALKRALRSFGNTFGLALYEKDKHRRETTDNMPAQISAEQFVALRDKAAIAGVSTDKIAQAYNARRLEELPADLFDRAMAKLDATIKVKGATNEAA
jgi:recombination DNA repair RAD52 pathway protein